MGQGQELIDEVTTMNEDVGETSTRKGDILAVTPTEDVIGNCYEVTLYYLPKGGYNSGMSS